ncbi:MAG: Pup-like protein [Actinomycetota bacterium]
MTEREYRSANSARQDQTEDVVMPTANKNEVDVTDILDEIDLVLEENAEEFVKSFVQKGGQ